MFNALIEQLTAKCKVFWQGAVKESAVKQLELLLGVRLPKSFQEFLKETGGGGATAELISGIEDGDPAIDNRGTVLGDTRMCRSEYKLPSDLVVIYYGEEDVVWCLDTSTYRQDECPVVAFDVFSQRVFPLNETFTAFFEDYVKLRSGEGEEGQKNVSGTNGTSGLA